MKRTIVLMAVIGLIPLSAHAAANEQACAKVDAGYSLLGSIHGVTGNTAPVSVCADVLDNGAKRTRRLRVYANGKLVVSNDDIVYGPDDGGMLGDPYTPPEIHHGSLIIRNQGGGGPLRWMNSWTLTVRHGRWIIAGWDNESIDFHSAEDGGGSFGLSVDALTGKIEYAYEPPGDNPKGRHAFRRTCTLPRKWRMPSISQVAKIDDIDWSCDGEK